MVKISDKTRKNCIHIYILRLNEIIFTEQIYMFKLKSSRLIQNKKVRTFIQMTQKFLYATMSMKEASKFQKTNFKCILVGRNQLFTFLHFK